MSTGLSNRDISIIKTVLQDFPEVESATLFGSRAKGNFKTGSDIDIAISLKKDSQKSIQEIHDKLEEETPLPYFFDVIDFNTIQNSDLIKHIKRVGIDILMYEPITNITSGSMKLIPSSKIES